MRECCRVSAKPLEACCCVEYGGAHQCGVLRGLHLGMCPVEGDSCCQPVHSPSSVSQVCRQSAAQCPGGQVFPVCGHPARLHHKQSRGDAQQSQAEQSMAGNADIKESLEHQLRPTHTRLYSSKHGTCWVFQSRPRYFAADLHWPCGLCNY
jgi:hypothetical protein